MSGEPVYLRAPTDSFFARAYRELAAIPASGVRWALIGGLAVSARLARSHRSTTDVDAVSTTPDELVELLVQAGGVRSRGHVKLHGIPIEPLPVPGKGRGQLPPARQWAFDGATELYVVVCDPDGAVVAEAAPNVATAAALVLLKLESAVHAFDRSAGKRATDVYDVLRLYSSNVAGMATSLAEAPRRLRADAAQCARDRLINKPVETLRHFSEEQLAEFDAGDLRYYGESLVGILRN